MTDRIELALTKVSTVSRSPFQPIDARWGIAESPRASSDILREHAVLCKSMEGIKKKLLVV